MDDLTCATCGRLIYEHGYLSGLPVCPSPPIRDREGRWIPSGECSERIIAAARASITDWFVNAEGFGWVWIAQPPQPWLEKVRLLASADRWEKEGMGEHAGWLREQAAVTPLLCPFCGAAPETVDASDYEVSHVRLLCNAEDCPANPEVIGATGASATAAWNRRAAPVTTTASNHDCRNGETPWTHSLVASLTEMFTEAKHVQVDGGRWVHALTEDEHRTVVSALRAAAR